MVFTFGVVWSTLCVAVSGGKMWAWALLAVIWASRFLLGAVMDKTVLRNHRSFWNFLLLPFRDFVAAGVWLASFAGNTVTWRGDRFQLRNGKLIRRVS
jgi:ceramide glucosyltransferase